jgi:hypothetical protein
MVNFIVKTKGLIKKIQLLSHHFFLILIFICDLVPNLLQIGFLAVEMPALITQFITRIVQSEINSRNCFVLILFKCNMIHEPSDLKWILDLLLHVTV